MEPGEWVVRQREAAGTRWVGGASSECLEKSEIESEWAEWQTELVEQQAYAKIDPRPDKEDEDDHDYYDDGQLHNPSFRRSIVQCKVPSRSGVVTQIGCSHGPRPLHGPAATAGSGLILHPARHRRAVQLSQSEPCDMNRLAQNSRAVLRRLAEGRVGPAYRSAPPACCGWR